ncbi:MAG: MFS transporter [Gemmatimonadota bacterium]|nr:MFS transporter [Gemmatimonadota bacterium]
MDRKQVGAWALYDFANSVFPAVMTTAVFPVYYITVVVADGGGAGEWWWGRAVALSALIVAVTSPLLGAIADRGGARKKFMFGWVGVCVAAVAAMTTLEAGMVIPGFVLFVVANVGFEGANVFYNAYLPDIAPPERRGFVSGLGFGIGYLGSAVGLMMAIPFVDRIELVWLLVAGFFFVFSLPAFFFLPEDRPTGITLPAAARWGFGNLRVIVSEVWANRELRKFLLAFFFYIDGVLTIIVMAGAVATETFGFDQRGTIVLFLIVQFSALAGAFALAGPTDRFGPKRVLSGVIVLWIATGVSAYFIQDAAVFYGLAVVAGLGLGSIQSASRALMASLVPEGREAEMFGFYALCGKTSSIIGPTLFGYVTLLADGNQRPGFLVLTGLFVVGLFLLQRVRDPVSGRVETAGS